MNKFIIFSLLCLCHVQLFAQAPQTPGEYLDYFGSRELNLSRKYMSYMSAVAHARRARKMEKRRQELTISIKQSVTDATRIKPYQGDASLKDAFKNYWDLLYKVFNEDYDKIVNMEEIAEQSYDKMEAYLLAQEKASEVLSEAHAKVIPVFEAFAAKNNVRLINSESKMQKQLIKVSEVNKYHRQLYLIFFKSFKQEVYVMEAYGRKDVNGVEQNRNTLIRFAEEGLAKLDTIKAFYNDGSLVKACRKVLEFHKNEAEKDIPAVVEFLIKSDEFGKLQKAFQAKPTDKITQAEVDQYNKAVNDINEGVNAINARQKTLNNDRQKALEQWENTSNRFLDTHVPKD
ncbi:MAG: LIC11966 family surface protein [Bacteroidota bacterium]